MGHGRRCRAHRRLHARARGWIVVAVVQEGRRHQQPAVPAHAPGRWTTTGTVFDTDLFTSALRNSIGISLIATTISVVLATLAAYAIARLEFQGKKLDAVDGAGHRHVPDGGAGRAAVRHVAVRSASTTRGSGLIIPYMSFTLPLSIWTLSAFFREIPWEMEQAAQVDGATPVAGVPQGDRAAGRARRVHRRHPHVLLRLERLRVRHLAHGHRQGPAGARRAGVLHRRVVRSSSRRRPSRPPRSS